MKFSLKVLLVSFIATQVSQAKLSAIYGEEVEGAAQPKIIAKPKVKPRAKKQSKFMRYYDKNRDGKLSYNEFPKKKRKKFHKFDLNGDGFVTESEIRRFDRKRDQKRKKTPVLYIAPKPVVNKRAYDYNDDALLESNLYNNHDASQDYGENYSENYNDNYYQNNQEDYTQDYSSDRMMGGNREHGMNSYSDHQPRRSKRVHPFIKKHDINYDNLLSRSEVPKRFRYRFNNWDLNGNHRLNSREVQIGFQKMKRKRQNKKAQGTQTHPFVKRYDRNRDGYVSYREMPIKIKHRFKVWDFNHDGGISSAEMRRALNKKRGY